MNDSNINRENLKPADLQLVKEVNKSKKNKNLKLKKRDKQYISDREQFNEDDQLLYYDYKNQQFKEGKKCLHL